MSKRSLIALLALIVAVTPVGTVAGEKPADPGLDLVAVKGGCFMMGDADGEFDARPVHEVCVDDFAIGKYEVTQEQYTKVMGESPSRATDCSTCPAEGVTWEQAQAFVKKLERASGKKYRLPTEAEWEYACRSGGKTQKYCGGDAFDELGWPATDNDTSHPVGQKKPNALGLHDMSGNADEWVSDWYGEVFYWVSPKDAPVGPSSSWSVLEDNEPNRVMRGQARATARAWGSPKSMGAHTGLRVALASGPSTLARAKPIPGKPGRAQGVEVLPKGGGAPGAAFTQWEKARADDMNHAFATLDKRSFVMKLLAMADAEAGRAPEKLTLTDQQVEAMYESAKQRQPATANTKIDGGIARGDLAILHSAKDKTPDGYSQTLVYMVRKDGVWTVRQSLGRFHAEMRSR
jgi:formylglycine-generating enzyme required for sulfatase activity